MFKKRLLMILLAVVFALAFAACGEDKAESEAAEETTAATEAEDLAAAEEAGDTDLSGYQTITLGNVEMDIPASWVYDSEAGAEMTHMYINGDESVIFQIDAMQTSEDVTDEVLGEYTQEIMDEWGYSDIGYYDTTVGDEINAKIIPVDASEQPDGMNQRIYTLGKDKTIVSLSFTMGDDDFTEMNKALETVHFLF